MRRDHSFLVHWGALGLLFVTGVVYAQDVGTLLSVTPRPTVHGTAVVVRIQGDQNGDATVTLRYRRAADTELTQGHPLVRVDPTHFLGALFRLEPDTSYHLEVTLADPDGHDQTSVADWTTRSSSPPSGSRSDLWVDPVSGDDENTGTSASPLRTIQAAVDTALAGTTIHLRPGIYRETVRTNVQGEVGNPVVIQAEGAGVVLTGADEELESGNVPWNDEGGGVYSTEFAHGCVYLAADDARLYDYQSLSDLDAGNGNTGTDGVIDGGFYVDETSGRLYVKMPDGSSPAGHVIHAAVLDRGIFLEGAANVVLRGLEVRYYGRVGIDVKNCLSCWVVDNSVHHCGAGITVRGPDGTDVFVAHNDLRDTSVFSWPWESCKHHTPEASGIAVTDGQGHEVWGNRIDGFFNGIYTGRWDTTDWAIARNIDVLDNVITHIGDDGLEPEGACVNQRFVGNIVAEVHNAVSLSPIETGPVWLVRNLLIGYRAHALKINNGPVGAVFVYHTTAVPAPDSDTAQAMEPSEVFGNFTFRNNIWGANRYVIEYGQTSLAGPVSMDYDDLWTWNVGGGQRFVKWLDQRYPDVAAFASATGMESAGFQVEPEFEDTSSWDYRPVAGSPLVDNGLLIGGINDRDTDGAPDIGAFERGGGHPGGQDGGLTPSPDGAVGPTPDGGLPNGDDATAHGDATTSLNDASTGGGSADSGCSCRQDGRPMGSWWLVAVIGVAIWKKRGVLTTDRKESRVQ